ncbi:MAG: type I-MYXAN CRISPR-associated Cas8a1/Cmx1 [Syntrophobacteraceae bacterium]
MQEKSLSFGLFDPGMTGMHRVGLAGLYMTLKNLNPDRYSDLGRWELSPKRVTVCWRKKPADLFKALINDAFGIDSHGCIRFCAHRGHPMGDIEIVHLDRVVRETFLQHGQMRKEAKENRVLQFDFQEQTVSETIKPIIEYRNQGAAELFLSKNGDKLVESVELAGWSYPGGAVRHNKYSAHTHLSIPPALFVPLIFTPIASLFFKISHRDKEGKLDARRRAAVVLPHIEDLEGYCKCYSRYLASPLRRLYADGLGDAGLMALILLHLQGGMLEDLSISSCTVVTFGSVPWNKRQKTRTGLRAVIKISSAHMNFFASALDSLDNRTLFRKDGGYWVETSRVRGLIAENIAAGMDWFRDFHQLMMSQKLAQLIRWERKGLSRMVAQMEWNHEADRLLVEAVHQALRNRYGAMAARAKERGDAPQFSREFERIRTSLMRAKNAQTMRAELADLFARGGLNKTLQMRWPELLPLFSGDDWQRARDLALLGLASYAGQGAEALDEAADMNFNQEEEDE